MDTDILAALAMFVLVALMIPTGLVALGFAFGSRRRRFTVGDNRELAFESGVSTGHAGRQKMPIDFYLTAMLFIVFDIEMVFLFPLAVVLGDAGLFGFLELVLFVTVLAVGFVYVWARGALEWE